MGRFVCRKAISYNRIFKSGLLKQNPSVFGEISKTTMTEETEEEEPEKTFFEDQAN
jgi:hypothetical protein